MTPDRAEREQSLFDHPHLEPAAEGLDDSWFNHPKAPSTIPPRISSRPPKEPIADEDSIDPIADDWFR